MERATFETEWVTIDLEGDTNALERISISIRLLNLVRPSAKTSGSDLDCKIRVMGKTNTLNSIYTLQYLMLALNFNKNGKLSES